MTLRYRIPPPIRYFLAAIVAFAIVFTVIVSSHELGHLLAARHHGVRVYAFSIGFGPKLIGYRIGQTEYMISLVPLGGYVLMEEGNPQDPTQHPESLAAATPWSRIQIFAAGPIMNIILALLLFTLAAMIGRKADLTVISKIDPGSLEEAAGLQVGDGLISIGGRNFASIEQSASYEAAYRTDAKGIPIEVCRLGQAITCHIPIEMINGPESPALNIHFSGTAQFHMRHKLCKALRIALYQTYGCIATLFRIFKPGKKSQAGPPSLCSRIAEHNTGTDERLCGPIMIMKIAADSLLRGKAALLTFMAALSVSIGTLNLFPILPLDGGHILFCVAEIVIGRPIGLEVQSLMTRIGTSLLFGLITWATLSDMRAVSRR